MSQESDQPGIARKDQLSRQVVGIVFLIGAVGLLLTLVYLIIFVVTPMTQTPSFMQAILENALNKEGEPKYSINFLISLEYASANIRMIGVQIAMASVGGFFLAVLGVLLFAVGIFKPFSVAASYAGSSFDWKDGSPGLFCALLGTILLLAGVFRPVLPLEEIHYSGGNSSNTMETETRDLYTKIESPPSEVDEEQLPKREEMPEAPTFDP